MEIVLLVIIAMILILFFPIKLKAKVNYNILKNEGNISGKVFWLRVILSKVVYKGKYLILTNQKGRARVLWLKDDESSKVTFGDKYIINFIKNVDYRTMKLYANVGLADNPLAMSLIWSVINIPLQYCIGLVKMNKSSTKIETGFFPSFYNNSATFNCCTVVEFNLWLLIVCLIKTLSKTKRRVKNGA